MFTLTIAGKDYTRPAEVLSDYQADHITARNIAEAITSPPVAAAIIAHLETFGMRAGDRLHDAVTERILALQVDTALSLDGRIEHTFTLDAGAANPYFQGRSFRTKAFVDMFLERVTPLVVGTDDRLWFFNPTIGQQVVGPKGETIIDTDGPYCPEGDALLARAYTIVAGDHYNDAHIRQIQSHIRNSVPRSGKFDPTQQDPDYLPFLNGILEIRTLHLHPHDPKFLYPSAIPHNWNAQAKCPTLDRAVAEIFKNDQQLVDLYFHIAGQVLYRGKPLQSISWWFYGRGRNGKSILGEHLRNMVGAQNTCNVPPQKLDERFVAQRLEGKSLNLCTDAPMQHFGDTSVFKMAVSGEVIEVERKNENQHEITPFATHVVGTNQRPTSPQDVSLGFRRRTCVLPFEVMFVPEPGPHQKQEDSTLGARLAAEIEGTLVRAVSSLRSTLLARDANNGTLVWEEPEACKREMKEVLKSSNPAIAYVAETFSEPTCFGPVTDRKFRQITASALYEHYKNWFVLSGCRGRPAPKADFLDEVCKSSADRSQITSLEHDPSTNQLIVAGLYAKALVEDHQKAVDDVAKKLGKSSEQIKAEAETGARVEDVVHASVPDANADDLDPTEAWIVNAASQITTDSQDTEE